jgi:hypothetical protein
MLVNFGLQAHAGARPLRWSRKERGTRRYRHQAFLSLDDSVNELRMLAPENFELLATSRARRNCVQSLVRAEEHAAAFALPCRVVANTAPLSDASVFPSHGHIIKLRHEASGVEF